MSDLWCSVHGRLRVNCGCVFAPVESSPAPEYSYSCPDCGSKGGGCLQVCEMFANEPKVEASREFCEECHRSKKRVEASQPFTALTTECLTASSDNMFLQPVGPTEASQPTTPPTPQPGAWMEAAATQLVTDSWIPRRIVCDQFDEDLAEDSITRAVKVTTEIIAAHAPAVPAPEWVSVEDRLPEVEDHCGVRESNVVLSVNGIHGTPKVTYMMASGKWHAYWGDYDICTPTHWMPLPAPPTLAGEPSPESVVPARPEVQMPRIVCLCGSTRFKDAFDEANYLETMAGRIVLSVGFMMHATGNRHGEDVGATPEQKVALDVLHKRKIDLADEVLILNVGGYIGESTRSELEHAIKQGKVIRYLEPL